MPWALLLFLVLCAIPYVYVPLLTFTYFSYIYLPFPTSTCILCICIIFVAPEWLSLCLLPSLCPNLIPCIYIPFPTFTCFSLRLNTLPISTSHFRFILLLIVLILGKNKTASPTFLVINFLLLHSLILFSLQIFCSKLCFQNPRIHVIASQRKHQFHRQIR
jgi:hypothetical protein